MTINVQIDEKLLAEARRLTGNVEATTVITTALEEFIARRHLRPLDGMLELAGTDPLRDDYDYKALRQGGGDDGDR